MIPEAASLSIIDRLIQLLTIRARNRQRYFDEYIEPLYRDAQAVMETYNTLFLELIRKLEQGEADVKILTWLEERRLESRPIRAKLRAFLEINNKPYSKTLNRFQRGMWGIMRGGLSMADEGHYDTGGYGYGDHTVLDYMKKHHWHEHDRHRCVDNARRQLGYIHQAWDDVVAGYAELKAKLV